MAKLGRNRVWREVTTPQDGAGGPETTAVERYCAACGQQVTAEGPPIERFGEPFCSEAHAEEFVNGVRAARVRAAALAQTTEVARPEETATRTPQQQSWKGLLKMGLCCGLPILALIVLAGGGGALLGAASGLLPVLALLACPLGMYFMMRSMSKRGQQDDGGDKGGQK